MNFNYTNSWESVIQTEISFSYPDTETYVLVIDNLDFHGWGFDSLRYSGIDQFSDTTPQSDVYFNFENTWHTEVGDGILDGWEHNYNLDPSNVYDSFLDPDNDGWDFNHDGTIDRAELTRLIQSMMQVLSGLSLDSHSKDIDYFVDELFGFDTDADAGLSWEEYREACDAMGDRMAHLGAHTKLTRSESAGRVAGARKSHAMK